MSYPNIRTYGIMNLVNRNQIRGFNMSSLYDSYPLIYPKLDTCFSLLMIMKSFLFKYCYKNKSRTSYIFHYYSSPYILKNSIYKHRINALNENKKTCVFKFKFVTDFTLNGKSRDDKFLLYNRFNIRDVISNKCDFTFFQRPFLHVKINKYLKPGVIYYSSTVT